MRVMLRDCRFESSVVLAEGHKTEEEPGMDLDREVSAADFLDRRECAAGRRVGCQPSSTHEERSSFE